MARKRNTTSPISMRSPSRRTTVDPSPASGIPFTIAGLVAERLTSALGDQPIPNLAGALSAAITALAGPDRELASGDLEVALLDRNGVRRCFRRLDDDEVSALLSPT